MVVLIVLISLIFGNGLLSNKLIVFIIGLFLVNPILSLILGAFIDEFFGDILKKITLTYEIFGHEFSFTAYAILMGILIWIII